MFENILIATDDSQLIKNAIKYTANAFPDAKYHVLNVINTSDRSVPKTDLLMEDLRKSAKMAIKDADEILHEMDINNIKKSVKKGVPSEEIVDYSQKHDIDLIVMGTQSKTGTQTHEIGRTCLHVLEHSHAPVLLFDNIVEIKKPKKILHPSSGSKYSMRAGYLAIKLTKYFDGEVEVLLTQGGGETERTFKEKGLENLNYLDDLRLETEHAFKKLYEFAKNNDIHYKLKSCAVKPEEDIVKESKKYDLIVGSLGRPGLKYKLRKIYPPFAVGKLEREIIVETKDPILFIED